MFKAFLVATTLITISHADEAIFAGGCFWCMESPFESIEGVSSAVSGYSGGKEDNPTYKQVAYGKTSHKEVVLVTYDPKKVNYETLVETFWKTCDPTDTLGQFADRGNHYKPAIYVNSPEQRKIAEASKEKLQKSKRFDRKIIVPIQQASKFWEAEGYHQNYYKKNPVHYWRYRKGSGRHDFLKTHWGYDIAEKH